MLIPRLEPFAKLGKRILALFEWKHHDVLVT